MSYPVVNLLRRDEMRYQGAVSRKFILLGLCVVPFLFVVVILGVQLLQKADALRSLKRANARWSEIEPQLVAYRKADRLLKDNKKILELLDGWNASKVPFAELMLDIQPLVPASIQLTHLSIQNTLPPGEYSKVDELGLKFEVSIKGYSHGQQAEYSVIDFRKKLLASDKMAQVAETIMLSSIRKRDANGGDVIREFALQGGSMMEGGE